MCITTNHQRQLYSSAEKHQQVQCTHSQHEACFCMYKGTDHSPANHPPRCVRLLPTRGGIWAQMIHKCAEFSAMCPDSGKAVLDAPNPCHILSTIPTVIGSCLDPASPTGGLDVGSLYLQLVCRHTLPLLAGISRNSNIYYI